MYQETYDFMAYSRKNAEKKMEAVIRKHYQKYGKMLKIQDLWQIWDTLWRCNLVYSDNKDEDN